MTHSIVVGVTRLALVVHARARRILLFGGLLFLVGGVFGGPVAGLLSAERTDFQDPSAENVTADERLERALGQDADLGVVALVPLQADARGDAAARAAVRRAEERYGALPEVVRTASFASTRDPGLLARDGRTALVGMALEDGVGRQDFAEELRAGAPDGVLIGGPDVVNPEIGHKVAEDLARAELLAFPLLFLLSLWVFRGLVAALLPPLTGALAVVVTFLVLRGVNGGVTGLSVFAVNLVTGMGLGLAIDYSLFVVSRYREELAAVGPGREALVRTMRTAGRTVLFSALTIAAAMASLLVFPLRFLYSMGIGGVIVALVAAGVALTVLPALLAVLGPRVDALAPARWQRAARTTARPTTEGGWYRLAHFVMRRPGRVALLAGGALLLLGLPFLRADFVAADHKMLPASSESRIVAERIDRDFAGAAAEPMRLVIEAPRADAGRVEAYADEVAALPGTGPVAEPRAVDRDTWLVEVVQPGDPLSDANQAVVDRVRALSAPFAVGVGGSAAAFADQQQALGERLPWALALLSVTTFVLLFLLTGSVVLPLKALLMNLLTVSAAFGILVVVFQDGRLEWLLDFESAGGLEATQPVLLFAIAFGLATDYGVFLLSRIKEARDGGMPDREAVAFGVERTGRIVTAAALLFCVAIGAFSTSGILFIKQVGVGTALAVAIDATIVRALLVPALMALLGRWNWWAPRPLRRLHARVGLRKAAA